MSKQDRGFTDVHRNRSGRNNENSLEQLPTNDRAQGVSSSVGKPLIGAYGYSAGPAASRRLEYMPQDSRAAPFEMHNQYGRNNSNHALTNTNDFSRHPDKYNFTQGIENERKGDRKDAEVVDGYTEYFSQGCDYNG